MIQSNLRYRNLYGDANKQRWEGIKPMTTSSDSNLIKGGARYIGFSFFSSGGGRLAILSKSNSGKWQHDAKMLIGHNGPILDLDFFPYNDSYLATCSDDATIKIWQIPEDAPLKEDITVCSSTLFGHSRKVNLIGFNDAAEGILASTSLDYTMKIWDVQKGEVKLNLTGPAEYCIGFEWGFNSDLIASTWKDKHLRVADVRSEQFQHTTAAHSEGGYQSQVAWLKEDHIITIGSNRNRDREYAIWDLRNIEKPLITKRIDSANGALYPFFDRDLGILYLAGKGDGNIKYYEYSDGELNTYANDYRSDKAGKGYGLLPKYALNTKRNEIARFAKLGENFVEQISYICPRKAEFFQEDLYPDCAFGTSLSADDWIKGQTAAAKRVSMRPTESELLQTQGNHKMQFVQKDKPNTDSSPTQVKEEVKSSSSHTNSSSSSSHANNDRIAELEKRVADLQTINESLAKELESTRSAVQGSDSSELVEQVSAQEKEILTLKDQLSHAHENINNVNRQRESDAAQSIQEKDDLHKEIALLKDALEETRAAVIAAKESSGSNSEAVNPNVGLAIEEKEQFEVQVKELENENENLLNQRNAIQDFLTKHGATVKGVLKLTNSDSVDDGQLRDHVNAIKEAAEQLQTLFVDINLEEAINE